ncbi:MAG TPA: hypothetical protein VMU16_02955 [Candidatus Binataceae bacterium]|nr:hypothetical protein [Candidatus Binataceae bacterium]
MTIFGAEFAPSATPSNVRLAGEIDRLAADASAGAITAVMQMTRSGRILYFAMSSIPAHEPDLKPAQDYPLIGKTEQARLTSGDALNPVLLSDRLPSFDSFNRRKTAADLTSSLRTNPARLL